MCLFGKYWKKLSRLFNRQLDYFLDNKLLPAVERLCFRKTSRGLFKETPSKLRKNLLNQVDFNLLFVTFKKNVIHHLLKKLQSSI